MRYYQVQFDQELEQMLKEGKSRGNDLMRIVSKQLHDRVVHTRDNRMKMACNAMWKLWKEQGSHMDRIIHTTPSNESSTIEIEFDSAYAYGGE